MIVMCRNQQDQHPRDCWMDSQRNPGRIDGANRESPGRLAHVLLMGSGKWPKRSHVEWGREPPHDSSTEVVAQGGVSLDCPHSRSCHEEMKGGGREKERKMHLDRIPRC